MKITEYKAGKRWVIRNKKSGLFYQEPNDTFVKLQDASAYKTKKIASEMCVGFPGDEPVCLKETVFVLQEK